MKCIQTDTYRFSLRGRHARGKHVLLNDTAACIARSFYTRKHDLPRFPEEGMGISARRHPKGNKVSWNVVRLDHIIHVGILEISPTAKLNVQLAPGAF